MTDDELRAAAARLLAGGNGYWRGDSAYAPEDDGEAVARAYLAEHDDTVADQAWVRQRIPPTKGPNNSAEARGRLGRLTWHGSGEMFCLWLNGELLPKNMTRGEFRRLANAIGVPLKE